MPDRAPETRFLFLPESFADESYPVREALREISETFDAQMTPDQGTFVPELLFGGASTGILYGVQQGDWIRLGPVVYLNMRLILTSKGTATGRATITGLPFEVADRLSSTAIEGLASVAYAVNMVGLTSAITANPVDIETIHMRHWGATGTSDLTDANFAGNAGLSLQAIYITDED